MPNKRSRHRKTPKFYCPYCGERLWRSGSKKHHVYYEDADSIKKNVGMSSRKAKLMARQGVYLDSNSWLEQFFCREDSHVWLLVSKGENGSYQTSLAQPHHWKRSTHTIDPDHPNPSVSEYTYRASRGRRL